MLRKIDSGASVYRNGPEWAELSEWTLISALEYDLCILVGQSGQGLPQKVICPRNIIYQLKCNFLYNFREICKTGKITI